MDGSEQKERQRETGDEGTAGAAEAPSAKVMRYATRQDHAGQMDKPDAYGVIAGDCGDTDEFFIKIFTSRIQEVRFRTTGCLYAIACCEAVALLAEGRTVREAMRIGQEAVIEHLDGLPEHYEHCALLAAGTLYQALRSYIIRGQGL